MTLSSDPNDPKAVWLNQQTGQSHPDLRDLRRRAHRLETTDRMRGAAFVVIGILQIAFSVGARMLGVRNLWWAGLINFTLVAIWGFYYPYIFYKRDWPISLFGDIGSSPGLAFYGRLLRHQIDRFRDPYVQRAVVVFMAFAFALNSIVYPRLIAPFAVIVAIWFVLSRRRARREMPELQRELEALRNYVPES